MKKYTKKHLLLALWYRLAQTDLRGRAIAILEFWRIQRLAQQFAADKVRMKPTSWGGVLVAIEERIQAQDDPEAFMKTSISFEEVLQLAKRAAQSDRIDKEIEKLRKQNA